MACRIIRSDAFEESYDRIIGYLARTLSSPNAAARLMQEVQRIADILESSPRIKAVSTKPLLESNGLREYYFQNYVIIYMVKDDTVTLVNLFHQTQDYESPQHWELNEAR